jgi:hypothetical protein
MAQNPLQQFFRQPKIYVGLPSQGIYNKPGTITGDPTRIPVFGMTGMDEIIMKTPDALLSGESTARVIGSCCPAITDPWDVSLLDVDLLLTAIRIATFGNELSVTSICKECGTENSYDINLNAIIDYFSNCKYENTIVMQELTVVTRPLTYKQSSNFSIKNFETQQKLKQLVSMEDEHERKIAMDSLFAEVAGLRNEVLTLAIESVSTGSAVVTERQFIREWLDNADTAVVQVIFDHVEANKDRWATPKQHVKCTNCEHEQDLVVDLDQSNFFAKA